MERVQPSTRAAGIDVGKSRLDVAAHGLEDTTAVRNAEDGFGTLLTWLLARGVRRVGLEASGGYERRVAAFLREQGLEVIVHQPAEVRAFARYRRVRAKNDRIDARLIAAATAQAETVKAACDPEISSLCERLTAYEQAAELVAQMKTFLEHVELPDLKASYKAQLAQLIAWKKALAKDLGVRIERHPELARRLALVRSIPGHGPIIAASLVLRMPELGHMSRGQASCLLGAAPFDRDSGASKGQRHIFGGRSRPRRMVYLAALVAKRIDKTFAAFANRLAANGKKPKVIIVAIMRKLIEAANLVLTRGSPWITP